MDETRWLERLKEDELNHLFLIAGLQHPHAHAEVIPPDKIGADALVMVQDNGINRLGGFFTQDPDALGAIADWFKGRNWLIEAPYDQMVRLLAKTGAARFPTRYYLLRHEQTGSPPTPKRLDFTVIRETAGHEKDLIHGLREIFRLGRREAADLLSVPAFQRHLSRGVHMFQSEGEMVGFVIVKNETDRYAELSNLWVRKPLRGKGYSAEIIQTMVQLAGEKNKTCCVTLSQESSGMLKFFENQNFELSRVLSREKLQ